MEMVLWPRVVYHPCSEGIIRQEVDEGTEEGMQRRERIVIDVYTVVSNSVGNSVGSTPGRDR